MLVALVGLARIDAHREGHVARASPAAVHARGRHDRLDVLDGQPALDLDRHEDLVVHRVRVVRAVQGGWTPAPGARAHGR